MRRRVYVLTATALFLIGLFGFLYGCGGKKRQEEAAEKMAENILEQASGGKADIDIQGSSVSIKTKEGTTNISQSSEWPDDLPGDVPDFPYGKVKAVTKADTEEGHSWLIQLGDLEKGALEKYVRELKDKRWDVEMTVTQKDMGAVQAKKDDLVLFYTVQGQNSANIHVTRSN